MTRSSVAAAVAIALEATHGLADEPKPSAYQTRAMLGQEMGTQQVHSLSIDGKKVDDEEADIYAGFHAGVSHLLSEQFALLALARWGAWSSTWGDLRNEYRYRVDVSIGPELRIVEKATHPRKGFHFSLPIGPSFGSIKPGPSGAVRETYSTPLGMNLGLMGGYDIAGLHHGAYFDVGWVLHVTWATHRETLNQQTVSQQYRWADHTLFFAIGYQYWL